MKMKEVGDNDKIYYYSCRCAHLLQICLPDNVIRFSLVQMFRFYRYREVANTYCNCRANSVGLVACPDCWTSGMTSLTVGCTFCWVQWLVFGGLGGREMALPPSALYRHLP